MITLIQRVEEASVTVEGQTVGRIGRGILVLLGLEKGDEQRDLDYHIKKLLNLRIFPDDQGKMNLSVQDIGGALLIVSQFTLAGSCRKGNRPGFDNAMPPAEAEVFYNRYLEQLREATPLQVETGVFGATMSVGLINDGPVTFILNSDRS